MTRYAQVAQGTAVTTRVVQSASPSDLVERVSVVLGDLSGLIVSAITLAGAGDGHAFTVTIEAAPSVVAGGLTNVVVDAFLGSDAAALELARAGATVAAPVVDLQVAGTASGLRYMGLLVGGVVGAEQGAAVVFESIAVAGTSQLSQFDATSTPDGTAAYVLSVRDAFVLERDASGLAADGITAVQALNVPNGRWQRRHGVGHESWRAQPEWHIDAGAGDDENAGSAAAPLASFAELARRYGADPFIEQVTDVFIESDLAETLAWIGTCRIASGALMRITGGVRATLDSGTLTNVTPLDAPTQQPLQLEAPGIDAFIRARVRITTGAAAGAVGWTFRSPGADLVDCTQTVQYDTSVNPLPPGATPATPGAGDDYAIEETWHVDSFNLAFAYDAGGAVNRLGAVIDSLTAEDGTLGCIVSLAHLARATVRSGAVDAHSNSHACLYELPAGAQLSGLQAVFDACLLHQTAGALSAVLQALLISNHTIVSASRLDIGVTTFTTVLGGLAVFDSPSSGINVNGRLLSSVPALVWGDGNADFGIEVRSGGLVTYDTQPILTGATNDTSIAGASTAYGGIPTFDTAHAAGIVESA